MQSEFESAKFSLAYVSNQWQKQNILPDERSVIPEGLKRTLAHLEVTYIIRLFATFEGLVKEYIKDHHPDITLPTNEERVKVGWYIDCVAQLQKPRISTVLRTRVYQVRACRNQLMHTGKTATPLVEFEEALLCLSKYLSFLPASL